MNDIQPRDVPIFGIHPVEELLASSRRQDIEHIYFDRDKKSAALFELIRTCRKERLSYNMVPEVRLNALTGNAKHEGVAAFCSVRPYNDIADLEKIIEAKQSPLFVIAASIEDPGNLGAIIRSCVCLGADALLLERKNTVPLNASVSRSSAGMIEQLCIVKPRNLEGLIGEFIQKKFSVVGADMKSGVIPSQNDFTRPTILITGGEHRGIPPYLRKLCTQTVSIPMSAGAQSLNASVAAALLLYECMRQRGFPNASL